MDPNYLEGSEVSTTAASAIEKLAINPPTEQDFDRERTRQRKTMGAAFDEIYTKANTDEGTARLLKSQNEEIRKMSRIGFSKVTIINLLPFKLQINGVLHSRYNTVVPPAPSEPQKKGGIPYARRVLDRIYFDHKDLGSDMQGIDQFIAVPWLPIELAQDFDREYNEIQGTGAVFFYEGDKIPESSEVLMHQLKEAQKNLFKWCEKRCQEADLEFANDESRKNITETHREAWRILRRDNVVKDDDKPAWLHSLTTNRVAPELCPGCDKPKAGAVCVNCGNVFKPLIAYREGMIEFGHVSFQKMTDDEFKEAQKLQQTRAKRTAQMGTKAGS
ncbi:MAG TPA: hypothetical protein VGP89_18030 [Candidatus Angelobacter sp.]|jgi:hypothetical protein|nr:hypothetical protein [Candidatus Angelobacter sp.]